MSACVLCSMLFSFRTWVIFFPVTALTSGTPSWSLRARPICAADEPDFARAMIFFSMVAADFVAMVGCCLGGS